MNIRRVFELHAHGLIAPNAVHSRRSRSDARDTVRTANYTYYDGSQTYGVTGVALISFLALAVARG